MSPKVQPLEPGKSQSGRCEGSLGKFIPLAEKETFKSVNRWGLLSTPNPGTQTR